MATPVMNKSVLITHSKIVIHSQVKCPDKWSASYFLSSVFFMNRIISMRSLCNETMNEST